MRGLWWGLGSAGRHVGVRLVAIAIVLVLGADLGVVAARGRTVAPPPAAAEPPLLPTRIEPTSPSPSPPTESHADETLAETLVDEVPGMTPVPEFTGPLDLELLSDPDWFGGDEEAGEALRDELTAAGFVGGYERTFSTPDESLMVAVDVLAFADVAGAVAFAEAEEAGALADVEAGVAEPWPVPDHPEVDGYSYDADADADGEVHVRTVGFRSGSRVYRLLIDHDAVLPDEDEVLAVLDAQLALARVAGAD